MLRGGAWNRDFLILYRVDLYDDLSFSLSIIFLSIYHEECNKSLTNSSIKALSLSVPILASNIPPHTDIGLRPKIFLKLENYKMS